MDSHFWLDWPFVEDAGVPLLYPEAGVVLYFEAAVFDVVGVLKLLPLVAADGRGG